MLDCQECSFVGQLGSPRFLFEQNTGQEEAAIARSCGSVTLTSCSTPGTAFGSCLLAPGVDIRSRPVHDSAGSLIADAVWELARGRSKMTSSSVLSEEEKMEVIQGALSSLTVDSVSKILQSEVIHGDDGAPIRSIWSEVSGTGLAPWEIHRPQQVVMELARRGAFQGRTVLDMGCGIGDNALYIARYCRDAQVTAFDFVPRCIEFARGKEALRQGMRGKVQWLVADMMNVADSWLAGQWFDAILDVCLFNAFNDREREVYVQAVKSLCKPGGTLYLVCINEHWPKWHPGGPRLITKEDIFSCFTHDDGFEVESIEDCNTEHHPSVNAGPDVPGRPGTSFEWKWRGWVESYLATIKRL